VAGPHADAEVVCPPFQRCSRGTLQCRGNTNVNCLASLLAPRKFHGTTKMPLAAPKLRIELCGWFVAVSYTWLHLASGDLRRGCQLPEKMPLRIPAKRSNKRPNRKRVTFDCNHFGRSGVERQVLPPLHQGQPSGLNRPRIWWGRRGCLDATPVCASVPY